MLNVIILIGRLTKDPEGRESKEGTSLCSFDIAVDNLKVEADGTRTATFLNVVCFDKTSDNVLKFARKGSKVGLKGRIEQSHYLAKDGTKKSTYRVIAESIELLDKVEKPAEEQEASEDVKEFEKPVEEKEAQFDPYTGKPLKKEKAKHII